MSCFLIESGEPDIDPPGAWQLVELQGFRTLEDGELTFILQRIRAGESGAEADLFAVAYDELHAAAAGLMRRERAEHTLQPSALINEAALRLLRQDALESLPDRAYFFAAMVRAMRHVLIDHARSRAAQRRGRGKASVSLDQVIDQMEKNSGIDLVALDDALHQLAAERERASQIVELRFFGGLSLSEIADQLKISLATVNREWRYARAKLLRQLQANDTPGDGF